LAIASASVTFHSKHDEFVAAMRATTSDVRTSRSSARDGLEHRVAGGVAVPIVHRLEFIEIEIDQRRVRSVPFDVGEGAFEFTLEAAAIERLGQRIDVDAAFEIADARTGGFGSAAAARPRRRPHGGRARTRLRRLRLFPAGFFVAGGVARVRRAPHKPVCLPTLPILFHDCPAPRIGKQY